MPENAIIRWYSYTCKSSDFRVFLEHIGIVISILYIFFILDCNIFLKNPARQIYYRLFYPYETSTSRERQDYYLIFGKN